MIRKNGLVALAVGVLIGTMAVVALADDQGWNTYGSEDSSVSSGSYQGGEQPNAGEIREPMETGAVPDRSGSSSELRSGMVGDEPTVEVGGQTYRPDIDFGP